MRSLVASLAVALSGLWILWHATDGGQAFTSEGARRLAVAREPRALPDPALQDQDGRNFRLSDYRGRLLLVEFIYTRCPTLCQALGASFARIAASLPRAGAGALLSISFDPDHDGPAQLAAFGISHGADGRRWRVARIDDAADLAAVLERFGIVVIPDPLFGYQHNAALHLVDRRGRLAGIFDYDAPEAALRAITP